MNLYIRLLWIAIKSYFGERVSTDSIKNQVSTIVLPNDLDINLHVNNGRFLTYCDLSRIDMFIRSGLARVMYQQKWTPIVSHVSMTFIKSLYLFDRIRIESDVTHWDEKYFYSTHSIYRRDTLVAEGTSRALVVSKKDGRIPPEIVIEAVDKLAQVSNR